MDTLGVNKEKWQKIGGSHMSVKAIKNKYKSLLDGLKSAAASANVHSEGLDVTFSVDGDEAIISSIFGSSKILLGWNDAPHGIEGVVLFVSTSQVTGKNQVIFQTVIPDSVRGGSFLVKSEDAASESSWGGNYPFVVMMNVLCKQIEFSTQ